MNVAGPAIRKARKERKLTQKELAARCGMAQSDISRIEGESGNPSVEILERIAKGLEMQLVLEFVFPDAGKRESKTRGKKTQPK
ncbi:MAG: helix-turn-helix domain-containing protein [Clostridiales bacterium]|nr:helix-turn-helix transcriptional regulator [Clostridia bacterium]MCR4883943.1 helix-turn-helix domain-containing protein [Clostridiales bacterium]